MYYAYLLSFMLFAAMVPHSYAQTTSSPFTFTSTALTEGSAVPQKFTCDGSDISPVLAWQNPPAQTKSFTIILSDPDAQSGTFYHWVLYNIPPSANTLAEGISRLPQGTIVGNNGWNRAQYNGPCPPKGSTHQYVMTLYALDITLNLTAGSNADAVLTAMKSHVLAQVKITNTFGR